jgi:hypothetical protein
VYPNLQLNLKLNLKIEVELAVNIAGNIKSKAWGCEYCLIYGLGDLFFMPG